YENLLAACDVDQHGRTAEVDIDAGVLRTIGVGHAAASASPIEHVRTDLVLPLDLAGIHVERDYGIGGIDFRPRVAVSGGNIDGLTLEVQGRRGPNGRARGTVELHAFRVLSRGLRL